jgi:hypothetical protein
LIEVTAGPLGAQNFPTENLPEMFFNKSEGKLYAVFDIDTTSETPKVSVEVHRPGDGIVHNQELPWNAILGQQKLETLPIVTTPEKAPFQIPFDPPAKHRVVILTDISNEPDDQMSLVRFLTYANEFDVEGILATTSCWRKNDPDLATIRQVIDAYGKAHDNLKRHAPGYPTAEQLHALSMSGIDGYGMSAAVGQFDNEGIAHIIKVLEKDDPRPVWLCVWGGANTLGGAVMKLQRDRPDDVERLVSKIRGYEIALQDDGFAYIAHHFPETKLISARLLWKGISRTTPKFNKWPESWGGNDCVFNAAWIKPHVQENHGPLGEQYPGADYLWEGDTPSFLYLMPNGLSNPEHVSYGSWGGDLNWLASEMLEAALAMKPWTTRSPVTMTTPFTRMHPILGATTERESKANTPPSSAGANTSRTISPHAWTGASQTTTARRTTIPLLVSMAILRRQS